MLPGVVCDALAAAGEQLSDAATCEPLAGGSIHAASAVQDGERRWFIKTNSAGALRQFEVEAAGLDLLAQSGSFRVPRVLGWGENGTQAWLLLEWLNLARPAGAADGAEFARSLAQMHRHTAQQFGLAGDNFIGANPQLNTCAGAWPYFFAQRRLAPQLDWARAKGYGGQLQSHGAYLVEKLAGFFVDHRPQASLLHGDLWIGNAAMCDGRPALFDPAVYYGDRETDLAMAELFGGFPASFYPAYREIWPLAEGYEQRKQLYNLYHVLNHLNLFGRGYLRQAERMAAMLAAELRT